MPNQTSGSAPFRESGQIRVQAGGGFVGNVTGGMAAAGDSRFDPCQGRDDLFGRLCDDNGLQAGKTVGTWETFGR